MITNNVLNKLIFFDLETVTGYASLEDAPARIQDLWCSKKCKNIRSRKEEYEDLTDAYIYKNEAALSGEFNKIVCITAGRFHESEDGKILKGVSYVAHDERKLLAETMKVFSHYIDKGYKLCGHNTGGFDIPVFLKRCVVNQISIPTNLYRHDIKKWDIPVVDTQEVWACQSWKDKCVSLDTLAALFGIDSPKDDINGSEVSRVYWEDGDLERIAKYCEKDVLTTANVALYLGNQPKVSKAVWKN